MHLNETSVLAERTHDEVEAREIVARDGAALIPRLLDLDAAMASAERVIGDDLVNIRRQFETKLGKKPVTAEPTEPDERGRVPNSPVRSPEESYAHNDGKSFGDFCPDYTFLWCERPCRLGGGSTVLVDSLRLLDLMAAEPELADVADFCWTVPIDHSEAYLQQDDLAPIARRVGTRVLARSHKNLRPAPGPDEADHEQKIDMWNRVVRAARSVGRRQLLRAGDMVVIDNYRVMHARDAFLDSNRKLHSIWGWSTDAVKVPPASLDFENPEHGLSTGEIAMLQSGGGILFAFREPAEASA